MKIFPAEVIYLLSGKNPQKSSQDHHKIF